MKMKTSKRFSALRTVMRSVMLIGCLLALSNTLALARQTVVNWDKELEKGYHELSIGNSKEAADFFTAKLRKYPDSAACHTGLGKSLKRLGKISDAKAEFKAATEAEPSYADAYYELGAAQESDRQWIEASQSFEKFLQLKPDASNRQALTDRIQFCKSQK